MRRIVWVLSLAILASNAVSLNAQESIPRHLQEAKILVSKLDLKNTNYEHGQGEIIWNGTVESHTDC